MLRENGRSFHVMPERLIVVLHVLNRIKMYHSVAMRYKHNKKILHEHSFLSSFSN